MKFAYLSTKKLATVADQRSHLVSTSPLLTIRSTQLLMGWRVPGASQVEAAILLDLLYCLERRQE
jgi:hypothetical protein